MCKIGISPKKAPVAPVEPVVPVEPVLPVKPVAPVPTGRGRESHISSLDKVFTHWLAIGRDFIDLIVHFLGPFRSEGTAI